MKRYEPTPCKLCRGRLSQYQYRLRSHHGIPFHAAECETCGLFQVVYDWHAQEPLGVTTDADEALAHPLWGSAQELSANESKAMAFAQRLANAGLIQRARVLDIGCGRGLFLRACRDLGAAAVTGQEFRRSDIAYARNVLDIEDIRPVETHRADVWPDDEFDLVCSIDVLEHVHDLKTIFEQCLRVLRPGGYLFHATPGYDSLSHHLGRRLARYSPVRYSLLAGILCNVDAPAIGGGHVSILGRRQLTWLENTFFLDIKEIQYVASYSYSNRHYATLIPQLRKLPTPIGSTMFALLRSTVKNKLTFLAERPSGS
jgi:2-polyprenyl-3-methyl-5-hydroxy-6-metoxy-1,4-benzoquinol methylase